MKTQILIVTYAPDAPFLEYCLRSIQKYASGFEKTIVLAPVVDAKAIGPLCELYGAEMRNDYRSAAPLGFLDHMAQKCFADRWCEGADFVLHTDSDCVFFAPVTPDDYFVDGKPVLVIEDYARLGPGNWKGPTETSMRLECKYETMRRHPAVHYRDLYPHLRRHIESAQTMGFRDYILTLKPDFPWGWSEFMALGQIAMLPEWRDAYHFIEVGKDEVPAPKLHQFWSHWGLDGTITDQGPYYGRTPRQVMQDWGL
jgi:hypothetical protein